MVKKMVMEHTLSLMEIILRENGRKGNKMRGHTLGLINTSMKGVGRVVKCGTEYITTIKETSLGNR
jgi:hypothetical protein